MTVYLTGAAHDQVDAAQEQLNRHALTLDGSLCVACGTAGPCLQRRAALRVLGRYDLLPRRRPGATRPDRLAARQRGGPGWFDRPVSAAG